MGLTIHYTLSAKGSLSASVVRELAQRTARYAHKIGCAKVSHLVRAEEHQDVAPLYFRAGKLKDGRYSCVAPALGWLVDVWPGQGCESATFGLCQYPRRTLVRGRSVATGFKGGWSFHGFCKTQYAGEHGWEHFLRCHRQVISLLDFWRGLGVMVKVIDEGGYWETRSEEKLRDELRQYDGLVAALGGMFKDACADSGGLSVKSPIFDYRNFERLEHEGRQKFGGRIEQLQRKLTRNTGG